SPHLGQYFHESTSPASNVQKYLRSFIRLPLVIKFLRAIFAKRRSAMRHYLRFTFDTDTDHSIVPPILYLKRLCVAFLSLMVIRFIGSYSTRTRCISQL